jgi:hypothetical protein
MPKWAMWAHFRYLSFNSFPMIWRALQANGFWPLKLHYENSRVHWDSNSQHGVHLGVWRFIPSHSLAFMGTWNVTPELPSWPATLQPLCLGCEPKVRVATIWECEGMNLTFSYTPKSMKCDSRASFLACTFASPCFGRKPKVKVVT